MEGQSPRRGEIWLAEFPAEIKSRPALIVSVDGRNQFGNSVLAVPLTTNAKPSQTHVLLPKGQGGISIASMARCENVTYMLRLRLRRGGFEGSISPALMREVEKALMRAVGISMP